ncbi:MULTISPECIES: hypothetical protein [unclassified Campylobacter]|uniref:hypothetical protein n=1 Tax=unclassified Campylobacter TaxID=2593542 RepID=UPI001473D594|nr:MULTISPECIES: hypothetical protein [unclassified Campylobacter]
MSKEHFYQASKQILEANNKEAIRAKESPALAKARHIKARAEQGDNTPFEAVFIRAKQFIDELEAQKELLKLNEAQSLENTKDYLNAEDTTSLNQAFYQQSDIIKEGVSGFILRMFGYDLDEMDYTYDKAD